MVNHDFQLRMMRGVSTSEEKTTIFADHIAICNLIRRGTRAGVIIMTNILA
ncbi:hypothetical protein BDE02_10G178600 [Populus trichocarpa]|nr:hypothetical protein BDE02_10G178600 [Populus trichocarpa]